MIHYTLPLPYKLRSNIPPRFRGRILTQPSSTPLASFNVIALDEPFSPMSANGVGPYGDKDDWAVFMQKVIKERIATIDLSKISI